MRLKISKIAVWIAIALFIPFGSAMAINWAGNQGFDKGKFPANQVTTDTTNFSKNLSSADTDVQKALETLDQLVSGGGSWSALTGTPPNISIFNNNSGYLVSAGASAGTYNNVTVATTGLVTSGSNVSYLTSVTAHNLLSTTHGDTATDSVVRGDVLTGQSAPAKWTRLAFPSTPTGKVLQATATDVAWSTNPLTIGANASVSGSNTGDQTLVGLGGAPTASPTFTGTVTLPTETNTVGALLLPAGTKLTSAVSGYIENDGTHLYYTSSTPTRLQLDQQSLTTSTVTNLTGFIKGNGSVLSADNSTYLTTESDPLSATKALDNLASVAINTTLLPAVAGAENLGSEALFFGTANLGTSLTFEGASDDAYQTTLSVVDPTGADHTINIPNAAGTMAVSATSPVTLSALGDIGLNDIALTTNTSGNYVATVATTAVTSGLTGGAAGSEGTAISLGFDYTATLAGNPTLNANQVVFGATGLIAEGATADTIETLLTFNDPITADKTITFPAETGTVAISASAPATLNSTTGDIGITVLKDLVTLAPLSGGTNDILVGADSDVTLSIADAVADGATKGASTYTALDFTASSGVISLNKTATLAGNPALGANNVEFSTTGLIFEGATNDTIETLLTVIDPTLTDKTITLPDASGTVAVSATAPITLSATGDIGVTANSSTTAGVVASGAGQNAQVWKTDANGVPAWRADAGGSFDSTTVEATTWGAGGNASNVWSFNLSAGDTTITFGNNLVTFSNGVTVTGALTATLTGTASGNPTTSSTDTFTNKRITKRVVTDGDAASITPNSDNADIEYQLNTQAAGTLTINADGGTPTNCQGWVLKIKSTNVQTLSWTGGAKGFLGGTLPTPTATTGGGKIDYFAFIFDTVNNAWHFSGQAVGF